MEPVEIRHSWKQTGIKLVLCLSLIPFTIFNTGNWSEWSLIEKISLPAAYMMMIAGSIYYARLLVLNKTIITLTSEFIKLQDTVYQWSEVNDWKIETDSDNDHKLIIVTNVSQKEIDLDMLEKSPEQIKALIATYK